MAINLDQLMQSVNVAKSLPEEERKKIAEDVYRGVNSDIESRRPWYNANINALKMALQIKENKSFPWPNAANVKYPLVTIASLQFQARAYANLVDTKNMVRGKVNGYDPSGEKAEKAERIGKHMTYQLMDKIENWDEDMDTLLIVLPVSGSAFKKVYYSNRNERETIDLVLPQDLVVNYWAKTLNSAKRVSHFYPLYHDEILSRMKEGIYLDIEDFPSAQYSPRPLDEDKLKQLTPEPSGDPEDHPHQICECHVKLDLDKDGILEPYVVVIDWETRTLLRIAPNFNKAGIITNNKGEVIEVKPRTYFVHYKFIPSPDGGFYGLGFGLLLGNLNETASTTINQLLDAGTWSITAGGFMTRSIKIKGGQVGFSPNEWKQISFTGDDIRKSLLPLPVREPSPVLFQLLQFIDQKANQIISISEISTGKLPGQNTPATTTMTSVQEGLRLFTSIYKRIYRSLKQELRLLFDVNKENLTDKEYFTFLDAGGAFQTEQVSAEDYNDEDLDIIPVADPNTTSESIRLIKAQQLVELIPLGGVDPAKASQRVLEALDIPNPQELMPQPQGPDPKTQQIQAKMQADQQKAQMDMQAQQLKIQTDLIKEKIKIGAMERKAELETQIKLQEAKLDEMKMALSLLGAQADHTQKVTHQREMNKLKEETARNGDNRTSSSK